MITTITRAASRLPHRLATVSFVCERERKAGAAIVPRALQLCRILPFVFGVCVVVICLPTYFQADDFDYFYWLQYENDSWHDWIDVMDVGFWRPIHIAFWWLETTLFGPSPLGYRIVHGVLYLLSVFAFSRMASKLLETERSACVATLLFASAYSHWEVIQWISAISELLVGLLALLFWYCMLRARAKSQVKWILCAAVLHFLALATKENSFALLPIAAVLLACRGELPRLRNRYAVLGIAVPWGAFLIWRLISAQGGDAVQTGFYRLVGAHPLHNAGAYIVRLFAPWIAIPSFSLALVALVAVLAVFAFLVRARCRLPACLIIWIAIALLPYLAFDIPRYFPSRYTHLAGIGWALLIAVLLDPLWRQTRAVRILSGCLLLCWCSANVALYSTGEEICYWRRNDSAFRSIVESLRAVELPVDANVEVRGLTIPEHQGPLHGFRTLYAMAHPPPSQGELTEEVGGGETFPDRILYRRNASYFVVDPNAGEGETVARWTPELFTEAGLTPIPHEASASARVDIPVGQPIQVTCRPGEAINLLFNDPIALRDGTASVTAHIDALQPALGTFVVMAVNPFEPTSWGYAESDIQSGRQDIVLQRAAVGTYFQVGIRITVSEASSQTGLFSIRGFEVVKERP